MYCPGCGAAEQDDAFCASCGITLNRASARAGGRAEAPTVIHNSTNVTVSVGGPMVVAGAGVDRIVVRDERGRSHTSTEWQHNSALIVAALVVMPIVGLPWVGAAGQWKTSTKWAVTGALFWPLWIRHILEQRWSPGLKVAAASLLVLGYAALFTAAAPAAVLLVGLPALIWAVRGTSTEVADASDNSVRDAIVDLLDRCNEAIADIERDLGVDLLSPESPVRKQYVRALELRRDVAEMIDSSHMIDFSLARQRATTALSDLLTVREALNSGAI